MKTKIVFEYSWKAKKFNDLNPNNRLLLGAIYEQGTEKFEVLAMCTDDNSINEKFSAQLSCFFKILEINKSLFMQYYDDKVKVELPKDDKIAGNPKLLKEYYYKETYILVCLKLIQKLLETNSFNSYDTATKLDVILEGQWYFPVWMDEKLLNQCFEDCNALEYEKFTSVGEDLINFPASIIFEQFVLWCCIRFVQDKKTVDCSAQILNLSNYIIMLG